MLSFPLDINPCKYYNVYSPTGANLMTPFMRWLATRLVMARHLRAYLRDTLANIQNTLSIKRKGDRHFVCPLFSFPNQPISSHFTTFVIRPIASTSQITSSPHCKNLGGSKPIPTPEGVPVEMMVPAFKVIPADSSLTI